MFRIIRDGTTFSEYALLRDGQSVLLRAATADDIPAVEQLMARVSREALQMRFMGAVSYVSRSVIETLCTGDPRDRLSLLAIAGQGENAQVIGMGNYLAVGPNEKAEVAFLVRDDFQGRGISTLLLERLAGIAAGYGLVGFEAEVLYENQAMINVFRDSGFEVCQAHNGGSIHVQFPVTGLASLRERVELRDRIAAANSLVPLLQPRTVAVVGASRDPDAVGSMIFRAILRGTFAGTAYPVNNQAAAVHGVRAYASMTDLPERADLVVVAVPAANVLGVVRDALKLGTKGLIVVTSGFAETGPEGAAVQNELVALVRSHGARLIGPNCLGLMNTHPDVSLNASLAPAMAPRGRIGFYSHSAALGLVILDYAAERGLGFSTFVSAGNRADVSGTDLLQYWEEDPSTDIALLYLETFGDARRFARVARRLSYRKPILCVKSARSRAGRDAARAHIAAAALSDTNVDVLFQQTGVLRANTLEEMFDVAVLLASQPLPRGNRVAVVSNSGGVLTICADACESHGLVTAAPHVVDLGPLVSVEAYEAAVEQAMEQEDVDALIAIYACIGSCDPQVVGRGIRRGVLRAERTTGVAKPALLCLMGAAGAVQLGSETAAETGPRHVFPSYRFPESAALALSRAVQYASFRAQPAGRLLWYDDVDAAAARHHVAAVIKAHPEQTVVHVGGEPAWEIARAFGVAVSEGPRSEVRGPKSEEDSTSNIGRLRPASASPAEARTDNRREEAGHRTSDRVQSIAVIEVTLDPNFGPLLKLTRTGGLPVLRITPLTDRDVREALADAGLAFDPDLQTLLGRISQLIEELPWVCGMIADVVPSPDARRGSRFALAPGLRMGLCP